MKETAVFIGLMLGLGSQARGTEFPRNSKIQVCSQIEFWDEKSSVPRAEQLANVIFATAAVRIQWQNAGSERPHKTCSALQDWQIVVRLVTGTPASFYPDALAFSQLEEGAVINIFFDRVVQIAAPKAEDRVLAHVLVHEITHLIQGLNRHSAEGIMKAKWSRSDLLQMNYKPLPFTPEDIRLIDLGLASRSRAPRPVELIAPNLVYPTAAAKR